MKIDLFSIGPLTVHGYGLMIGIGVLCCIFMGMKRAKKNGLSEDAVIDIAIWGLLAGFLGAKLLYVIVEWKRFLADPLSVLGSEGFVVYGGIIAGVLAAIIYCKRKKLVFLEYFDLCSASIALAHGSSFDEAWKKAYSALEGIKFEGMFYRKDIGLPGAAESN